MQPVLACTLFRLAERMTQTVVVRQDQMPAAVHHGQLSRTETVPFSLYDHAVLFQHLRAKLEHVDPNSQILALELYDLDDVFLKCEHLTNSYERNSIGNALQHICQLLAPVLPLVGLLNVLACHLCTTTEKNVSSTASLYEQCSTQSCKMIFMNYKNCTSHEAKRPLGVLPHTQGGPFALLHTRQYFSA